MSPVDELIRGFRVEPGEEGDAAERAATEMARRQLRTAGADEGRGRAGWLAHRARIWRSGLVPVLAGAAATAVVVVAALLPERGVQSARPKETPLTLASALDRAANAAIRQPAVYPNPHQFQYLAVEERSMGGGGGPGTVGPDFWISDVKQDWVRANGSGRERIVETGRGFVTAADRAWARAHRESLGSFLPNQSSDGTYPPAAGNPPGSGIGVWNPLSSVRLTTQAAALGAFENSLGVPRGRLALRRVHTLARVRAALAFDISTRLLTTASSPELRAVLYRMIARLPGVRLLGWQTDRIGRSGVAVAIVDHGYRNELLFDPSTSDVLQTQSILVQAQGPPKAGTLPKGTAVGYEVILASGIVNSIEALPGGGRVPFHP